MAKQSRPETRDEKIARLQREIGLIGDHAASYFQNFGEEGTRAIHQQKLDELGRLRAS
jgi:hypothetical protein